MSNRLFSDRDFDRHFTITEKIIKRSFITILVLWIFGVLLSLGITGVAIWAIIKLVTHFCS